MGIVTALTPTDVVVVLVALGEIYLDRVRHLVLDALLDKRLTCKRFAFKLKSLKIYLLDYIFVPIFAN